MAQPSISDEEFNEPEQDTSVADDFETVLEGIEIPTQIKLLRSYAAFLSVKETAKDQQVLKRRKISNDQEELGGYF